MQPGTGRMLMSGRHSGSLPRPSRFLSLVLAREAGESVDEAQFTDEVRRPGLMLVASERVRTMPRSGTVFGDIKLRTAST